MPQTSTQENGPMMEKGIAGIESAVGVKLPEHYRRFLLEHAQSLKAAKKKLPMRGILYFEPKQITEINRGLRHNPRMIEINGDSEPWPLNYFVVGTNGGGDYWMVDLNDTKEAIWKYDSESGGVIVPSEHASWAEYMAAVKRDLQNPQKWQ
jgi:hypothetical protein